MKICLIGDSLTNLVLAKNLLSRKIKIELLYKEIKKNNNTSRTLGISRENIDYLNNNICDLKNLGWGIKKIKVFKENDKKNEILNFGSYNKELFSTISYNKLFNKLNSLLLKEKNFKKHKIKKKLFYSELIKKNYNLIISSEKNNRIVKNNFISIVNKDYHTTAYSVVISHARCENKVASQIFTKLGPIAFLPISNYKTSIVFSILNKNNNFQEISLKKLINEYSSNYKIKSFSEFEKFKLKFFFPRNYHFKNILLFGDALHQIHPLAGQGFNMTLRDIKTFLKIIDEHIELGLSIDKAILFKFEKKIKHLNFIFSHGIDFIHEFFKFDNKLNNKISNELFNCFSKNKLIKRYIEDIANRGINF